MVSEKLLTTAILVLFAFLLLSKNCNNTNVVKTHLVHKTPNLQGVSNKAVKEFRVKSTDQNVPESTEVFKDFAPTSYSLLPRTPNYGSYPAKVEVTETFLSWNEFQLPDSLPVHALRLRNKMPQLAILLDPSKLPKGPTSGPSNFKVGPKDFPWWPQTYEPVFPDYVETDKLYDLPKECIMTAPRKEKGLRIIKVTQKGASSAVSVALFPFIGPYGSDTKDICFPENSRTMSTLGGKIDFIDKGFRGTLDRSGYLQSYHPGGSTIPPWSDGKIDSFRSKARRREASFGNYINAAKMVYSALKFYPVKGKHVLVVGSAPHPWMEAIMLEFGARKVTTSEYQVPKLTGTKYNGIMNTIHHETLLMNPIQFDMICSYSSLEHDGLGRYHDPVSPDADLQQLQNLHNLLKPGGHMLLQVPLKPKDDVNMNEGRHYGPVRYPLLVAPFELDAMIYLNDVRLKEGKDPNGGANKVKTLEKCFDTMLKSGIKMKDGYLKGEQCISMLKKKDV